MPMQIRLETKVKGHYRKVMEKFDRQLFEALLPRNAKVEIVEFTGSQKGNRVHLRFLSPLKMDWISDITEDGENEKEAYFIDEGIKLPPGLSFWRHKHIVRKLSEDTSLIIDDISFQGSNILLSILFYPMIYLGFSPRKRIYQEYFNNLSQTQNE